MEEPCRVRAEGGSDYEGEKGGDEVYTREYPSHNKIHDRHPLVHFPEVYNGTGEEQKDGGVQEGRKESDE